jgi:tetratricopeptide (TPR) repeat protein
MSKINPYVAGNPISQSDGFFGRESILKEVEFVLAQPHANAIVLYGQRRIGKTSILLQLRLQLGEKREYLPIYLDLQDKSSLSLQDLLYRLAQDISSVSGQMAPARHLFDDNGDYFRREFLPKISAETPVVLLFDEFDVLDAPSRQAGQAFFPYLRMWMSEIANVNFVFVIGRRPEDLSTETLSTFKGVRTARVSLLDRAHTDALVRQSESKGGPMWDDLAVQRLWEITQGHPYFTQLMCSVIWERHAIVSPENVDAAIESALKQGEHSFLWLWDGLPPAEKVVIAAMAQADATFVSQDDLVQIMNNSGIRLIVRELEVAPETLTEWEILKCDHDAYAFVVPMFRRWIAINFPLRRVKDQLDRLTPLAETLFETGQHYYNLDRLADAQGQLRQSLLINPNHLKSRLLLGRILLDEGEISQAVLILGEAYNYNQAARADYLRALLASAEGAPEDEQVAIYQKITSIEPGQRTALERLAQVQEVRRAREVQELLARASYCESEEDWDSAVSTYRSLLIQVVDESGDLRLRMHEAERQAGLAQTYNEALGALQTKNRALAVRLLATIISEDPDYKEAARHLFQATSGIDVNALEEELKLEKARALEAEKRSAGLAPTDEADFTRAFNAIFGSGDLEAMIKCPICGAHVKGKNFLKHYLPRHFKRP